MWSCGDAGGVALDISLLFVAEGCRRQTINCSVQFVQFIDLAAGVMDVAQIMASQSRSTDAGLLAEVK